MKKIYKYSLATIVLSLSLVGCSMTKTNSIATMTDDRITTGSIKNNSIQGSTLKTDIKVPRVFYFEFDEVVLRLELYLNKYELIDYKSFIYKVLENENL